MAKGYGEAMALIEAGKQIALTAMKAEMEREKPKRTPEKKEKPPSFDELWQQEKKRRDAFDAWMKDVKKIMAEDKKDDKKKPWEDVDKVALLLLGILPLNWALMFLLFK